MFTISKIVKLLAFYLQYSNPFLLVGRPGIGKTDIIKQAVKMAGYELIISHAVVSDPTDFKGLPFANDGQADFLPFGDLNKLINATSPLVVFFDDLGQAAEATQAAIMQLILAREINGKKIPDCVRFVAATNARKHKAGVSGMITPLKSRFSGIIELEYSHEDWLKWAILQNFPVELLAFARFRPDYWINYNATKEISPDCTPRTLSMLGEMLNNCPEDLDFKYNLALANSGQAFAIEFKAFCQLFGQLPDIAQILLNPETAAVPNGNDAKFALCGALARKATATSFDAIATYAERLPQEFQVLLMKDSCNYSPEIVTTKGFIAMASRLGDVLI